MTISPRAYGIQWVEDLFAPADEDGRYTTDVEAFLGAQQEWMANNLPKKGIIAETTNWGEVKLPPKAERGCRKPSKSDCTAMYLDRDGRVRSVHYRMPVAKKPKGKDAVIGDDSADASAVSKTRPDVTRKGVEMIGDYRTDALHEALARAPIEDDTLMALLILAFAGQNVSVDSGSGGTRYGNRRIARHATALFDQDGKLVLDMDMLRVAARSTLADVLSCRENRTDSGIVARIAGDVVGADNFLPNMGTDDFLSCLSRAALEGSRKDTPVLPRQKVKDTRAALVDHFKEGRFMPAAALFAPDKAAVSSWLAKNAVAAEATRPTTSSRTRRSPTAMATTPRTPRRSRRQRNSPPAYDNLHDSSRRRLCRRRFRFHSHEQEDVMSAKSIYDLAALGAIIRFSDGTRRPPERHRKKLAAWEHRNSSGRPIRKQGRTPCRQHCHQRKASRCMPATMVVAASWCFASTAPSRSTAT